MCTEVEKYFPSSTSGFSHHDSRKSEVDGKEGENDHPAVDLFDDISNLYCILKKFLEPAMFCHLAVLI